MSVNDLSNNWDTAKPCPPAITAEKAQVPLALHLSVVTCSGQIGIKNCKPCRASGKAVSTSVQ